MTSSTRCQFESILARPPAYRNTILLVLCAGTALVLHQMGRRLWCACGTIVPWSFDVGSMHNSQHLIDPYTPSHIIHGLFFYCLLRYTLPTVAMGWRLVIATLMEIAWEIIENTPMVINRYREETAALGYEGDSILNSLADIACAILGFWLALRLPWWMSVGLVVVFEVGCLLWIRDNLTLNVIMLLHPIDAIREWQAGD